MSRTIWKYTLTWPHDGMTFEMPADAEFRVARLTGDLERLPTIDMWFEVDSTRPAEPVTVEIFGTGQTIPDGATYLATVFDDPWVWHLFRIPAGQTS